MLVGFEEFVWFRVVYFLFLFGYLVICVVGGLVIWWLVRWVLVVWVWLSCLLWMLCWFVWFVYFGLVRLIWWLLTYLGEYLWLFDCGWVLCLCLCGFVCFDFCSFKVCTLLLLCVFVLGVLAIVLLVIGYVVLVLCLMVLVCVYLLCLCFGYVAGWFLWVGDFWCFVDCLFLIVVGVLILFFIVCALLVLWFSCEVCF